MEQAFYVSLSGQLALQRRMDTIANNVANGTTTGFRAEHVSFETVLSNADRQPVAFVAPSNAHFLQQSGSLQETGNPLDVAIQGNAFFAIATPAGFAYTRDGRMKITPEGDLQSITGFPILDIGGAPIQLNPVGGPIEVRPDGTIRQDGQNRGALGLFELPPNAKLTRYGTSGFTADIAALPAVDTTETRLHQGYLEGSNVNPMLEMVRLIEVTRTFQAISNSVETTDRTLSDAIRTLAGSS